MTPNRYTHIAIALHWLMAVLLIALFAVGVYMHELPLSPQKLQIYSWHKWAGVSLFLLVLVRLAWRNQPMHWLPTQVHYPLDGLSHFRLWHDNALISKMHAKLFFGMLLRAPQILWHRWRA